MGRYIRPVCRLCRREKVKLFLKGEKCFANCVLDKGKKKNVPGQRDRRGSSKMGGYARHLREKQKAKRIAGVNEEQFRNYFRIAEKSKGLTGENLLLLIERRLDNVVHRLGFASSRQFARQLVGHGHVLINNCIKRAPGYKVKVGDKITLKPKLQENIYIKKALERPESIPSWLNIDKTTSVGEVVSLPSRQEVSYPVDESLIVELYKK
jgi:small subunit ribosomal protein S4